MTQSDLEQKSRRSIRLRDYDYTLAGAYFVTVCTQDRIPQFGDVVDNSVSLNDAGKMVQSVWEQLPKHYLGIDIDAFVVMPNHVHGIVILTDMDPAVFQPGSAIVDTGQPRGVAPTTMSLPAVVHRFKSLTTTKYRHGVVQHGWKHFQQRLWQRNYYERIIRNEIELNSIREYIYNNPASWSQDEINPLREALS